MPLRSVLVASTVLLFGVAQSLALADVTLDSPFVLSGSEVHALNATFAEARKDNVVDLSDTELQHTKIIVNDGPTATVTFIQDGHAKARYQFDYSTLIARRSDGQDTLVASDGVALSGLATKAVSTVYTDWLSGKLMVLSKDDLDADRFKIKAHELINPQNNLPHFWITYYPAVDHYVMTGCPVRQSYGVDIETWKTIIEGTIC